MRTEGEGCEVRFSPWVPGLGAGLRGVGRRGLFPPPFRSLSGGSRLLGGFLVSGSSTGATTASAIHAGLVVSGGKHNHGINWLTHQHSHHAEASQALSLLRGSDSVRVPGGSSAHTQQHVNLVQQTCINKNQAKETFSILTSNTNVL